MARVERFHCKSKVTVKHNAPWAKVIAKVGDVYIAYESEADAEDEHGKFFTSAKDVKGVRGFDWIKANSSLYNPGKIIRDARRRGENA